MLHQTVMNRISFLLIARLHPPIGIESLVFLLEVGNQEGFQPFDNGGYFFHGLLRWLLLGCCFQLMQVIHHLLVFLGHWGSKTGLLCLDVRKDDVILCGKDPQEQTFYF